MEQKKRKEKKRKENYHVGAFLAEASGKLPRQREAGRIIVENTAYRDPSEFWERIVINEMAYCPI